MTPVALEDAPGHVRESAKILQAIKSFGLQSPQTLKRAGIRTRRSADASPGEIHSIVGLDDTHGVLINPEIVTPVSLESYSIDLPIRIPGHGKTAVLPLARPKDLSADFEANPGSEAFLDWIRETLFQRVLYAEGGGILGVSMERDHETEEQRAALPVTELEARAENMIVFMTSTDHFGRALNPLRALEFTVKRGVSADEIDYGTIVERKNTIAGEIRMGMEALLQNNKVDLLKGRAALKNVREISIDGKSV